MLKYQKTSKIDYLTMSSKLSKVLNISLEDYIAKKGIAPSPLPKPADSPVTDYFKRPLRSEMETDDDENENELKEVSAKLEEIDIDGKVPTDVGEVPAKEIYDPEGHNCSQTKPKKSVRFDMRTSRENMISKTSGDTSLKTVKTVFVRNTDRMMASLNENANFRKFDARNRINQRLGNNQGQRHRNRNNPNKNNRNQYGKNPNMKPSFNPSFHHLSERNNVPMNKNRIMNLRRCIESSPSPQPKGIVRPLVSNGAWRPAEQLAQPQLITFANMLSQIDQTADDEDRQMFSNTIHNVMMRNQYQQEPSAAIVPTQMNSTQLMPIAAQTLFDHIATVQQNFGPKYDMELQKEIHTLQNKALLYQSNGVVSMDGPGISGEQVKPVTTDVSMNMRFS